MTAVSHRSVILSALHVLMSCRSCLISFVGICPLWDQDRSSTEIIKEYCENMPEFAFRTRVKAGTTGFAQVYGKYFDTTPYDKLKLDLFYLRIIPLDGSQADPDDRENSPEKGRYGGHCRGTGDSAEGCGGSGSGISRRNCEGNREKVAGILEYEGIDSHKSERIFAAV